MRPTNKLPLKIACAAACLLRIVAGGQTKDDVVELPPFEFTEDRIGPEWKYAEVDGFEIISQCSTQETQAIVDALSRGRVLTLPAAFRPQLATPMAVVLFDQRPAPGGSVKPVGSAQGPGDTKGTHWTNLIKRTAPDREVFCANLWGGRFQYSAAFRFDLRTVLNFRVPAAPDWMRAGLFGPYGIYNEYITHHPDERQAEISAATWCSAAEQQEVLALAAGLRRSEEIPLQKRPREVKFDFSQPSPVAIHLLPIERLWNPPAPRESADDTLSRWAATCALFVRWSLFAEAGRYGKGFWSMAEEACSHPVTEEMFRQYYGIGYQEAFVRMSWYFPRALSETSRYRVDSPRIPKVELRSATAAEIARVRGDWERTEALALAAKFPEISARYRARAGRTLRNAYAKAPADNRLATVLGLYEYDCGNLDHARELLEKSAVDPTMRPLAWLVLGELRLKAAKAAPQGRGGKLSVAQVTAVLESLFKARARAPAMIQTYGLLADAWESYEGVPPQENLAVLLEGVRLFPRDQDFIFKAASLYARCGYREEALRLCDLGVELASTSAASDRFRQLREAAAIAPKDISSH